jgi:hypothetical protein
MNNRLRALLTLPLLLTLTACPAEEPTRSNRNEPRTTHYAFVQVRGTALTYCAEVSEVTEYFDAASRIHVTQIDTVGSVVPVIGDVMNPTQCEILESEGSRLPYYVVDGAAPY